MSFNNFERFLTPKCEKVTDVTQTDVHGLLPERMPNLSHISEESKKKNEKQFFELGQES